MRTSHCVEPRKAVALVVVVLVAVVSCLFASCGRSHSSGAPDGTHVGTPASPEGTPKTVSLDAALAQIDAYPVPKDVNAQTWTMLVAELKKQLIARSKDGKTLSIAPAGSLNAVTDLTASSDAAGTQATLTWTEKLGGDCNNDGQVSIADLQPIALHYGETSSGPGSAAYLADANGDGQVDITDLQPIAADYSMHIEGYQVWRGAYNGTTTTWEATFRPNVGDPANTSFTVDRTTSPPATSRPTYTFLDDITTLADKTNVRYKVTAYGDGAAGVDSNEAVMPPPGTTYSVSGTVTHSLIGLPGVTMTLTPGGLSATTGADGTYSIVNVPNGSYTLTPALSGYSFTPPSRSVTMSGFNRSGFDFAGAPVPGAYSVSGTVTHMPLGPLPGVTMTLAPGGLTATTAADGTYTISGVSNGSYTLTPALSGYIFTPATRSVNVSGADVTGQDFDGTPSGTTYTLSGTVVTGTPPAGLAGVTVTLSPGGLNASTGASGTYTITGVPDGSYTVVPTMDGVAFTPPSRLASVSGGNVIGQDFTAYASGLATSPWPKFHMDVANTGVSPYVGPQTSAVKWVHVTGGQVWSSPTIGPDGTIYIGSDDKKIYALNPSDGSEKWSDATTGVVEGGPAIGLDGTVYVGSGDGNVYALDPTNGSVKWTRATGGEVWGSPSIALDGTIYVASYGGFFIYALNPADGSVKWSTPVTQPWSSPAIGPDGTVYIGSRDVPGHVYALDPLTGAVKWTFTAGDWVDTPPAVGADGTVYVGSRDSDTNVYALNPANGSVKWQYLTGGTGLWACAAIGADGTVYIGSADKNLYALDPSFGFVKWSFTASGGVLTPAIGADGKIYFGTWSGDFYALSPSGSVVWSGVTGSVPGSPAIGADGTLYFGSLNGDVYAVGP